jgi:hypothetical protein
LRTTHLEDSCRLLEDTPGRRLLGWSPPSMSPSGPWITLAPEWLVDRNFDRTVEPENGGLCPLFHFVDVRQYPGLVEKRLLRAVQTKENLKIAAVRRHSVRLLGCWCPRAEEDVQRAVGILLHTSAVRRAAGARCLANQRVRLAVVRGGGPVQLHGRVRWDVNGRPSCKIISERSKIRSKQFGNHARGALGTVVLHRLKMRRSSERFHHRLCNHFGL